MQFQTQPRNMALGLCRSSSALCGPGSEAAISRFEAFSLKCSILPNIGRSPGQAGFRRASVQSVPPSAVAPAGVRARRAAKYSENRLHIVGFLRGGRRCTVNQFSIGRTS